MTLMMKEKVVDLVEIGLKKKVKFFFRIKITFLITNLMNHYYFL